MKIFVANFGRLIALFVALAMLNSSVAMAAYVCPKAERQLAAMAEMTEMAGHEAAAGMDHGQPDEASPCMQQHAGNKQAVELSSSPPDPAPPAVISVQPLAATALPAWQRVARSTVLQDYPGHAPPFLRTLRLRI